jgi:hypothetical protein
MTSTGQVCEALAPGVPVKFTGGRYNGFTGVIRLCGDTVAAVVITYNNQPHEVIDDLCFMTLITPPRSLISPEAKSP